MHSVFHCLSCNEQFDQEIRVPVTFMCCSQTVCAECFYSENTDNLKQCYMMDMHYTGLDRG